MKNYLILLIAIGFVCCSPVRTSNPDDNYSETWEAPTTEQLNDITRILIAKNISGCGEYKVKTRLDSEKEFLVACTSDSKTWTFYAVYAGSKDVMGPLSDNFKQP